MYRLRMNVFAYLIVAMLVAQLIEAGYAGAALADVGPPSLCGSWHIVHSPSPGNPSFLQGIASVPGTRLAWTVGVYLDSEADYKSLIEHWNGTRWMVVPSPNVDWEWTFLQAVVAISANDAWAVGETPNQGVVEHWNGTRWSLVPSPYIENVSLFGVAASSANDIWAVGEDSEGSPIEHWNGTRWSVVPSPQFYESKLYGVATVSSNDVWAVGNYTKSDFKTKTLIEHWDGKNWQVVPSPSPGTSNNELKSVTHVPGTNEVWAVGDYLDLGFHHNKTLIEHWDGKSWQIIPSLNAPKSTNLLQGVDAASKSRIWTVGTHLGPSSGQLVKILTERWDGAHWRIIPGANHNSDYNFLYGVAITSTKDVWAVGNFGNGQTLIEHYC
jgi:hypothetical protein